MTDLTYLSLDKLKTIPLIELLNLKPNLDKAIEELQKDKKAELIAALHQQAKANGISLKEFGSITSRKVKETKTPLPPKYRNPNNINETWSGHGRKPKWIESLLTYGRELKDLEIK